jgi:hypothetical protein
MFMGGSVICDEHLGIWLDYIQKCLQDKPLYYPDLTIDPIFASAEKALVEEGHESISEASSVLSANEQTV